MYDLARTSSMANRHRRSVQNHFTLAEPKYSHGQLKYEKVECVLSFLFLPALVMSDRFLQQTATLGVLVLQTGNYSLTWPSTIISRPEPSLATASITVRDSDLELSMMKKNVLLCNCLFPFHSSTAVHPTRLWL